MTPSFSTMTPYDLVVLRVEFLSDMFTLFRKYHNMRIFLAQSHLVCPFTMSGSLSCEMTMILA
jgi:hypothetical protein